MLELLKPGITILSWLLTLGLTLSLYFRGCIFYPLLVLVAGIAGQCLTSLCGMAISGLVPTSTVSVIAFLAQPCFMSVLLFGFCSTIWGMAYMHAWSMVRWGFRKDQCELMAFARKFLYQQFDHIGLASTSPPCRSPGRPTAGQVLVVKTARATGERLQFHAPMKMEPGAPSQGEVTVFLDPSVRYQTCTGFGGAFTETSAELLKRMGSANQELIIDAYFKGGVGIGYSIGRVHMNSCDFSFGNWACCEEEDKELKSFSIDRYNQAILPMVKRAAAALGRPLTLFASPWSPPAWMKDTGRMMNGGRLKEDCREAWAKYYVRFAEKLKEAGFPLWGFTVQNEPDAANGWENCVFSAEEERDFIRDHLGPALEKSGLDLKLLAWDHNRDDLFRRAVTIEKDAEAAKYVHGYGWHWYGDVRYDWWADPGDHSCFENVRRVHELCPDKHLWITEVCQELGSHIGDWSVAERYADTILRDFNNWCEAFVDWNLILDHTGGPNHVGNNCSAPVIVDVAKDRVLFQPSFSYIGHFSRFIQPGAQRILSSTSRAALEAIAFANPDGTTAVVVLNQTDNSAAFCLACEGFAVRCASEAHSILTLTFLSEGLGKKQAG
mmetsp:Transcript_49972/g.154434  ORF Transcript_49972/g.154434 Transcript_49972/m.154434 type:complete len:608 (-) Transcript_49972:32-1855(-)